MYLYSLLKLAWNCFSLKIAKKLKNKNFPKYVYMYYVHAVCDILYVMYTWYNLSISYWSLKRHKSATFYKIRFADKKTYVNTVIFKNHSNEQN